MRIMTDSPIRFPGLFGDWEFTASSTAFHVGGKAIYWYGILIALGVVLALWFCMTQKEKYGITEDDLLDAVLWGVPLSVVGARVYYVIFYLDLFKKSDGSFDWGSAVAIWDGGLAIYGAVIVGVIVALIYTKRHKIPFFAMSDLAVMGLLLGQIIGRWANFINREALHGSRILKRQARPANGNQAKHRYAGLLTCRECGNTFIPMIRCWNGKNRVEYVCRGYHRNGKTYCASHRIHEEVLDAEVQACAETVREQCAEEVEKLAQLQKMWALRKPILDAHILSLQGNIQKLEMKVDEIVMEKLSCRS